MKIGILTFHASHNYGSMLQAYALQTYLQGEGHEVKIINLRIPAQKSYYGNPLFKFEKSAIRYILHPTLFYQNIKKWYKFESFINDHYNLTAECQKLVEVEAIIDDENFEAVITGGDQIWNINARDFSIAYYLPFDNNRIKKIAYSPSFGSGERFAPSHYRAIIKSLLSSYDILSVRDKAGSKLVTELFGREIPAMTDPTLLLCRNLYEEMAGDTPIIKGRYIFYYSPSNRKDYEKMALEYAKKYNLPIYTSNGSPKDCKGMKHVNNAGPVEFLNLLRHADCVCGKSFHLVVFSLILHKQFLAITGSTDARMSGLLEACDLCDHVIATTDVIANKQLSEINWDKVDEQLSKMKQFGAEYLFKALNK